MFEKEIFNKKCKWLIVWKKWSFMLWEQGVEGSNPFAPTVENQGVTKTRNSFFHAKTENLHAICTQTFDFCTKLVQFFRMITLPITQNQGFVICFLLYGGFA